MMDQVNNKTVTIVGDPDQSIFGWRMAEPKNFKKMSDEFENTFAINMEQNYRSTSKVIDAAMHVITQGKGKQCSQRTSVLTFTFQIPSVLTKLFIPITPRVSPWL